MGLQTARATAGLVRIDAIAERTWQDQARGAEACEGEEVAHIATYAPAKPGPEGPGNAPSNGHSAATGVTRTIAGGALLLAVVLVGLIVLGAGGSYTVKAVFRDASGLVPGDDVLIGPARVGTINSIGLTADGRAIVAIGLHGDASPLHAGTVARIAEGSLSGDANHYIVLSPGPSSAPEIPDGGSIPPTDAYAEVSLDQLFDSLDPLTRAGIRGLVRGEAASIAGRARAANRTLHYLTPALASTSQVTAQLTRDEGAFDGLLVQGARTMEALASRSQQLTQLVAAGDVATGAVAARSQHLQQAIRLLPDALNRSTATFTGLRSTLDALDPVVAATKPAARRLAPFAAALRGLSEASIPTITALAGLIHAPAGGGDLTALFEKTPPLARLAVAAFPQLIAEMNASQLQLDYLREYAPDVIAALTNLGQASAYYDADGHYTRTQPFFNAFGLDPTGGLVSRSPADRGVGLQIVHGRCPGGAVQAAPDGSNTQAVPGCTTSSTPPGP